MDQRKRPSDKTYSEVMNEWAAQRNLVNADRSRLLHPPFDAHPVARFFGYMLRVGVVILLPAVVYLVLLSAHLRSKDFNDLLSNGLNDGLQAVKTETRGAQWNADGILSAKSLTADGNPDSFYEAFEARNLGTRISFPQLFRREWILPRVSLGELSIALRSGGLGKVPLYELEDNAPDLPSGVRPGGPKTGQVKRPALPVLLAGYGISPDFKQLKINTLQTAKLNATWGSAPATSGAVTGMQTDLTRTANGWVISGNGGEFRQSWLDGMQVEKLGVRLDPKEAVIEEATFTRAGGGKGGFTGRITLGEQPELAGLMQLTGIALQDLVPVVAGGMFSAKASGAVKMAGSVNRSRGIGMEGELQLESGKLTALPVLMALHQLTGEDEFRRPGIKSGDVKFKTYGAENGVGLVVEVTDCAVDCGPLLRVKGTLHYEQTREPGTIDGRPAAEQIKVSGAFKLGISAEVTARLKRAVTERFFVKDPDGWSWLEIKVDGPVTPGLTKKLAAEMLEASAAVP